MKAKYVLLYFSYNLTQLAKRGMNIMLMSRSHAKLEKVAVEIGNIAQIIFCTQSIALQLCFTNSSVILFGNVLVFHCLV